MIRLQPIPRNTPQKFDVLADFLNKDRNVLFAYLFGGLARNRFGPLTDVDLAFYLKNVKKGDYLEMFGNVSDILGTDEIDLVILNRAPISLAGRILQSRRVLIDKSPFRRHLYESLVLREFFDFSVKERQILQRRYGIG
jgi:uncharacterized protein